MALTQLPIGTKVRLTEDHMFNEAGDIVTIIERPAQWDEWGVDPSLAADHDARHALGDDLPGPLAIFSDSEYEVVEQVAA